MGHRTLVLLINDSMHEWSKDTELGNLIATAASRAPDSAGQRGFGSGMSHISNNYGFVVETAHADTQRLAVIDSYGMSTLAIGHWSSSDMQRTRDLALLKLAAEKLGYKLVKA